MCTRHFTTYFSRIIIYVHAKFQRIFFLLLLQPFRDVGSAFVSSSDENVRSRKMSRKLFYQETKSLSTLFLFRFKFRIENPVDGYLRVVVSVENTDEMCFPRRAIMRTVYIIYFIRERRERATINFYLLFGVTCERERK